MMTSHASQEYYNLALPPNRSKCPPIVRGGSYCKLTKLVFITSKETFLVPYSSRLLKIYFLLNVIWTLLKRIRFTTSRVFTNTGYLQITLKKADKAMFALDKCIDPE